VHPRLQPGASVRPLSSTVRGHLGLPLSLGAAALILGAIGFARAVAEFGTPGAVAFAKFTLTPVALVASVLLLAPPRPPNLLPSNQALKVVLGIVLGLTIVAWGLSAAFGVAWLVSK
jgi:hypothetical protein